MTSFKYFSKLLKKFKNSSYLGYKSKHVHNEPTEADFILIKQITKLTKSERKVELHNKGVKTCVNKTIGHANETIQYEELESTKLMTTCDKEENKYKEYLSANDINII